MSESLKAQFEAEMKRTAYQRKAVARMPASEVLDLAIAFFTERGYRSGRTGRPNQAFVMGGKEGLLPRVTGEIKVQADVGKAKVTMVTMDAVGERLGPAMEAFAKELRAKRQAAS
ncbi:MAG TPA: hypothetical protein VM450_02725 [Thermomicrobiales bacterium]|nr:hypothetical protein [Thermomicrobiales bacterium]